MNLHVQAKFCHLQRCKKVIISCELPSLWLSCLILTYSGDASHVTLLSVLLFLQPSCSVPSVCCDKRQNGNNTIIKIIVLKYQVSYELRYIFTTSTITSCQGHLLHGSIRYSKSLYEADYLPNGTYMVISLAHCSLLQALVKTCQ